jgi:hypothetical protein
MAAVLIGPTTKTTTTTARFNYATIELRVISTEEFQFALLTGIIWTRLQDF